MKVVVTGASGLIGSALTASLRAGGDQVVTLVRRTPGSASEIAWDPLTPLGGLDPGVLDGTDAVVHLAGAGVADHRWTESYKEEIRASRVQGTGALTTFLAAMDQPPAVLLSGFRRRLVRGHRRPGSGRVRPGGQRVPGRRGAGLGSRRRPGPAGRDPGGHPAHRDRDVPPGRGAGQAAAPVPARPGREARPGHPVHELGEPGRLDPGGPFPRGPPGDIRPGEPHRAGAGDQRGLHHGAGGRAAPPGVAEHPVPGAVDGPRRRDQRPDDQRPGAAPGAARGRIRVHLPGPGRRARRRTAARGSPPSRTRSPPGRNCGAPRRGTP